MNITGLIAKTHTLSWGGSKAAYVRVYDMLQTEHRHDSAIGVATFDNWDGPLLMEFDADGWCTHQAGVYFQCVEV